MQNQLLAISPIDGRYHKFTQRLKNYFSEYAFIQFRIRIEVEYFIALCEVPIPQLKEFDRSKYIELRGLYLNFKMKDALLIKEIEATTNHDVKAVEYFMKENLQNLKLGKFKEFVHFGLTSQDINNTAIPLSVKEFIENEYIPEISKLLVNLTELAEEWKNIPMLAHTHGQPASPTRLGKEIMVFVERMNQQLKQLRHLPYSAKFGGANGNFNAHNAAYPNIDWRIFAEGFVNGSLGLRQSWPTTQIEHYDNLAALFDCLKRINNIIMDLNRDMWTYIFMGYFKQKIKKGEVGSSVMPHKINPIDFENSEGNLGIANALFEHLSSKLPISRLQRDLTDSTVLRNIGIPLGHTLIALHSTIKGLNRVLLNEDKISQDLEDNWAVIGEGIQNILRREGYPNPYETLKELTRTNEAITQNSINNFIDKLDLSEVIKAELKSITPHNYTGV